MEVSRGQCRQAAVERGGNVLKVFKTFVTENGSRQGQNLALTVVCVPNSLDSATAEKKSWATPGGALYSQFRMSMVNPILAWGRYGLTPTILSIQSNQRIRRPGEDDSGEDQIA